MTRTALNLTSHSDFRPHILKNADHRANGPKFGPLE